MPLFWTESQIACAHFKIEQCTFLVSEFCIEDVGNRKVFVPKFSREKRRRAKLAAELDRKQKEEKAAEARRPSVEENASKPPKLSAILKGARGLGAFKKKG